MTTPNPCTYLAEIHGLATTYTVSQVSIRIFMPSTKRRLLPDGGAAIVQVIF